MISWIKKLFGHNRADRGAPDLAQIRQDWDGLLQFMYGPDSKDAKNNPVRLADSVNKLLEDLPSIAGRDTVLASKIVEQVSGLIPENPHLGDILFDKGMQSLVSMTQRPLAENAFFAVKIYYGLKVLANHDPERAEPVFTNGLALLRNITSDPGSKAHIDPLVQDLINRSGGETERFSAVVDAALNSSRDPSQLYLTFKDIHTRVKNSSLNPELETIVFEKSLDILPRMSVIGRKNISLVPFDTLAGMANRNHGHKAVFFNRALDVMPFFMATDRGGAVRAFTKLAHMASQEPGLIGNFLYQDFSPLKKDILKDRFAMTALFSVLAKARSPYPETQLRPVVKPLLDLMDAFNGRNKKAARARAFPHPTLR